MTVVGDLATDTPLFAHERVIESQGILMPPHNEPSEVTELFYKAIIDAVPQRVAVIDHEGKIIFVNRPWQEGAHARGLSESLDWTGFNYFAVCDTAEGDDQDDATQASNGIRAVAQGRTELFRMEYPCHDGENKHWFMMTAVPLRWGDNTAIVVAHHEITDRVLAEHRVRDMALHDATTRLPNRRHFDQFTEQLWLRSRRYQTPIALLMMDVDDLKIINDQQGHAKGDLSLSLVGKSLKSMVQRPDDLAARIGGDEFALVMGNTPLHEATAIAQRIVESLRQRQPKDSASTAVPPITLSIGVAACQPNAETGFKQLFNAADEALYRAKKSGGDQWAESPESSIDR